MGISKPVTPVLPAHTHTDNENEIQNKIWSEEVEEKLREASEWFKNK